MRFTFSRVLVLHAYLALFLASIAGFASAQNMKPGLWEVASKMSGEKGSQFAEALLKMQEQMISMPLEQRKQIEAMLLEKGMATSFEVGGVTSTKICISKEMIEAGQTPASADGKCVHNNAARAGNVQKFSFSCTKPPSSGEGVITFDGDENYSKSMSVTVDRDGRSEKVTISGNSKFLSSDCGDIKPIASTVPKN